ncbi:MAG: methylmalonyl-CoA mutase family protein [Bacteroidota bacterium]
MTQEWISEFAGVKEGEWLNQLLKELKGDESRLTIYDEIEEISYSTYNYPDCEILVDQSSSNLNIQRGFFKSQNRWRNGIQVIITNEAAANKKALNALMAGCDFIHFISKRKTNWNIVLKEIELPYIHSTFSIHDSDDFHSLIEIIGFDKLSYCSFDLPKKSISVNEIFNLIKIIQLPIIQIDGFSLNQCGANATQELAFILTESHVELLNLMDHGLSIDEAAACIHFRLGIGANYLVEISKFRALKILWANLIKSYKPKHNCSLNCQITAEVGWVNKSLKDPYTNLLRQTTEAMSAIFGGIERLIIQPYDACSMRGTSDLSQRMALNISNILCDECYFSNVMDPLGGSYVIEIKSKLLATKGWELFKKIDCLSPELQDEQWKKLITAKANQRIERVRNGQDTLIGVNKYFNLQEIACDWASPISFQGMPFLRLETEL